MIAESPESRSLRARADERFVRAIPIAFARRHGILGLTPTGDAMPLLIAPDASAEALDAVARLLDCDVNLTPTPRDEVLAAIDHAYGEQRVDVDQVLDHLTSGKVELQEQAEAVAKADRNDLLDSGSRSPIIKLVNLLLLEAVQQGASDVHVQPYEDKLVARLRVDGVLFDAFTLPARVSEEVISRLKVMGRMDIAEKRLPQDGRASIRVGERVVDLRIASLPTSFGERIVVRFLDKNVRLYSLDELGMDAGTLFRFRMAIGIEHGIILVTGPTGSGKTTTLYGTLAEMDTTHKNVLTLEDPIEYQLPGLSQTQINVKKGLTFASGLRNVLRQDPDVIMVGEIRDHETATMAIQSALTGHLVFSTLHTNDAASAVTRLLDLGIEPYLVASSLVAVLAQRLVRRVCNRCAEPASLSEMDLTRLGASPENFVDGQPRRGRGCEHCRNTGYRGRVGLYELMILNEPIRRLISQRALATQIESEAVAAGLLTLRHDGMAKIAAGITTVDEVVRVTARAAL